ncbi:MAG: hypothetical protein WAV50_03410 [Minisyncoccia bacterium]
MRYSFYDSPEYRDKQARITRGNVAKGVYKSLKKEEERLCARDGCGDFFVTFPSNPKKFCSQSCAATVNNSKRIWSEDIKRKISEAAKGRPNSLKGVLKVPRVTVVCANPKCQKVFTHERYRPRKYCCVYCSMVVTGGRPTSPKASRGKAGIRKDVSEFIYFYSRWEANVARLYTYLKVKWEYTPKSFDIGGHSYTPDFYLSETDTYIEVKNFWGEYSRVRDEKFRATHPDIRLEVILKDEYLDLEKKYAHLIPCWEYKNSVFKIK